MALKIANIDINKGYLGDLELSVAYLGAIEASFIKSDFIISVKTDNTGTSADNEFTLPWIGTYDIDWGDGTKEENVTDSQTHTYASAGTYDVKVKAVSGRILFNGTGDRLKLLDIKNWGVCIWTSMEAAFKGCENLSKMSASDSPDLSSVTSMANTFVDVPLEVNLNNWDVSNVSNFAYMAYASYQKVGFNSQIDQWDISGTVSLNYMFYDNKNFNQPIGNWDTSNITTMVGALRGVASFDYSLAGWNIENIPSWGLQGLLLSAGMSTSNYDATLISWAAQTPQNNVSISFGSSQYSYEAAAARNTLIDTYGWTITDGGQGVAPEFALKWETTTPNEEIQIGVGDGTFDYVIDWGDGTVESYNTDANISHIYADAGDHITKITGNFPHMNMQNITDDVYREKLRDVLNWGTIVWQDWTSMFRNCSGFTALTATDLPNLSNVTSFVYLASGGNFGYHYNSSVQNWDVSNVTSMAGFSHYGDWRNKISTWDTSNVTDFTNFLRACGNFDNGGDLADMDNFDVSSAINMNWMFNRTTQMANVYIGSWDVSNVTSMNTTFNPLAMTNSGLENWDISNVSNFSQFNAYGQTNISLANWTPTSMTYAGSFWFDNRAMSVANYDATLISWAGQTLQNNVTIDFGSSQYSYESAAARQTLIDTYGWTITDGGQAVVPEFVISVKTDNAGSSSDNQFTLPWIGTYDIDWGDGSVETGLVDTQTHTYPSAGTYDVKVTAVSGKIEFRYVGDRLKLLDIKNWGTCQWTSLQNSFFECKNITNISAIDTPDFSIMNSLKFSFYNCPNLISMDVSTWDVSNVTEAEVAFQSCVNLETLNGIENWTFQVLNINGLKATFNNCRKFNSNIGGWTYVGPILENVLNNCDMFNHSLANWDLTTVNFGSPIILPNATGISQANYDETLISWSSQSLLSNKTLNMGGSQYTLGGEAEAARNTLINTYGWTIVDGGGI